MTRMRICQCAWRIQLSMLLLLQLIQHAYGTRAMVGYNLCVILLYAGLVTNVAAGFMYPPFGQVCFVSAVRSDWHAPCCFC